MPKVLIDIPEQYLKLIHSDSPINWLSMAGFLNFIRNGIVLDELTNGEVFHKVFPDVDVDGDIMFWHGVDWWNRKWGE